ncbi:MAG TPA: aspartate/glutamate racemase family protein [Nocardioides sp.]|uniref:aspartate/glutamate racemase family protein n=1 Tax=Nocardioides sp. TaxID=35761 RepID=UPI002CB3E2F8|nr:aspartate/glutamate racemase family protein [Nocardioides sp.]HTW14224.1 aspartate/glutamate racemase family protein [Nocardioides sp.]
MRLLAITPIVVDEAELARRQARYDELAPDGVRVVLERLEEGPRALETEADMRASEEALLARYRQADPAEWDGFLPDCVLDPLVDGDHGLQRPVFGIGRLAAGFVAAQGGRLGAVARNAAIAAELDRRLASYGVATVAPTAVLDLAVEDISDDAVWAAAVARTVDGLDCDFVLNACSAVEVEEQRSAPYLLDPTAAALALLAHRGAVTGVRA